MQYVNLLVELSHQWSQLIFRTITSSLLVFLTSAFAITL